MDVIKIRKGLDLPLTGSAALRTTDARGVGLYAVKPGDYVGLVPRLMVAEGDHVRVGDPLLCDKHDSRICLTSPVEGCVKAIVRGDKRALLAVVVECERGREMENGELKSENEPTSAHTPQFVKEAMLRTGLWAMLRQRPYGTIANPDDSPKAIVVSAFDSAPLAADNDYALQGREEEFVAGLKALATLTKGRLHICFRQGQRLAQAVTNGLDGNVELHFVEGPHPAGNVGTQIARLCPIDKGDRVWTMNPQDVAVLGHLMRTGEYAPERVVAVAGPAARNPQYYRVRMGACVESLLKEQLPVEGNTRIVSGNVLSGTRIEADGFVGGYDSLLTLLPEGDYYDFMGWLLPGLRKHSFSRTFLSGFMPERKGLKLKFDTNRHGDVRSFVFTGNFERVFPFDIYPLQLIKACIVGDMELQEKLGIYEVEPEDFALCEYIDVSKTDIQPIIREALEKLRKEGA